MHDEADESRCLHHEACPNCGSRNNLGRYSDGHAWCFGCGHYEPGDGSTPMTRRPRMAEGLIEGEVQALPKRGINEETCRKFGYRVGVNRAGKKVQIAEGRNAAGDVVAQHLRTADKGFTWAGDSKEVVLWGQHLCRGSGRRIVVTEGEIDALSVSQAFGNTWDVVSLPSGAQSGKKYIQRSLEFLEAYDEVVLWMDADEAGSAAAADCAPLFTPGRCKVVGETGSKDANELLLGAGVKAVCSAVYNAKTYRPDGVVSASDIREAVLADPMMGRPYPWDGVTRATFGRQPGQCIALGAGTGVGKTDLFTQMIEFDLNVLQIRTGLLMLEQGTGETGKRIAGKAVGKRFHIPDGSWTKAELVEAWDRIEGSNLLHLYDSFGAVTWDVVRAKIRYLVASLGCEHIYLDHLTALAAAEDDEKKSLEKIMAELAGMAKSMGFILHFVSHLTTPDGTPHEEGGRVFIKQFKGSRAIGYWSHMMFGLERHTQAEDQEERRVATFRCLKDRFTGNANGLTFRLAFDASTGLLSEAPPEPDPMREDEDGDGPPF